jgi:hypothetical protein
MPKGFIFSYFPGDSGVDLPLILVDRACSHWAAGLTEESEENRRPVGK